MTATASNASFLFGSPARGDARPESDHDLAVFLGNFDGFGKEEARIAAKAWALLDGLSS
ncbi:MAG: nucleotidyltransferase domain-containing protein [Roseiarcus sp.]